jgi:hypothetical protein
MYAVHAVAHILGERAGNRKFCGVVNAPSPQKFVLRRHYVIMAIIINKSKGK